MSEIRKCTAHRSSSFPKVKERNVCLKGAGAADGRGGGGEAWKGITSVDGEFFLGNGISDDFNLSPYVFLLSTWPIFYHENIYSFSNQTENEFYFKGKKELKTEVTWTSKLAGEKKLAADLIEPRWRGFSSWGALNCWRSIVLWNFSPLYFIWNGSGREVFLLRL